MEKKIAQKKIKMFELKSKIKINKQKIIDSLSLYKNDFFDEDSFYDFLKKLSHTLYGCNFDEDEIDLLIYILIDWNLLNIYHLNKKKRYYTFNNSLNIELLILADIYNNNFFSHSTASYIHGLSTSLDNIYISQLFQNKTNNKNKLYQENIDNAFKRKMRSIKKPLKLHYQNNDTYNPIYLLSQYCDISKFTEESLGIESKEIDGNIISVSSIERTLIEIVVRPGYAKNLQSIIDIYIKAKPYIDIYKLFNILKNLDYVYPYHQSIGFLLEIAGYKDSDLEEFKKRPINFEFYIDYESNKNNLAFCNTWKIYYPRDII